MSAEKERNDRLTALLPRIQALAQHYVTRYRPDLDPLEVSQEAALAFLQRAADDPAFLRQQDRAIVARAVKDGWNAARSQSRHERHQTPLDDDYPGEEPGPEETALLADLEERVREILSHLKPAYRAVARGLMAGRPRGEIMRGLGTKPQAFTYYRRQLGHAFMALA